MAKPSDIRPVGAALHFLPIRTRMPLKFGPEVTTEVTCARVRLTVEDRQGRRAVGWGETPLSVQWVWPSTQPYEARHGVLKRLCARLVEGWAHLDAWGHPLEVGHAFTETVLPRYHEETQADARASAGSGLPWLAALVTSSPFDLALHDAFGRLLDRPTYQTYT
ncbi:MAG TPA: hypothetical protein VFT74_16995, partial [Isosphaeraceae bacterium]|nr:hypothetical protein [Isosphaeraceae bacterium]